MGSSKKVQAPPPRDYKQEMMTALAAQDEAFAKMLDLDEKYRPQLEVAQKRRTFGQMNLLEDAYTRGMALSDKLNTAQLNYLQPQLTRIGKYANTAYEETLGPTASGLLKSLQTSAASELALGGQLSEQEKNLANQAARGASAAMGLGSGNQAIGMEVLSNYGLSQQREAARRAFAGNVYNMSQTSTGQAYNLFGTPALQSLVDAPGLLSGGAKAFSNMTTSGNFTGESGYQAALLTSNRKEQMDAAMFNAQQSNAAKNAGIAAIGSIAGAFLGGPAFGALMAGGLAAKSPWKATPKEDYA